MKLKRSAVALLKRIKRHILAKPERFDMQDWGRPNDGETPCGTAACIAGWAVILSSKDPQKFYRAAKLDQKDIDKGVDDTRPSRLAKLLHGPNNSAFDKAQKLLGLSDEQAGDLFYQGRWPEQFRGGLHSNLAKRAAKRIDHLIETGE